MTGRISSDVGARKAIAAMQRVIGERDTVWIEQVLVALASIPPSDAILPCVLREDAVWQSARSHRPGDLQRRGEHWALLVRGKGHDRLVYLRDDVAAALHTCLEARGPGRPDTLGPSLITAVGNRAGGRCLGRRGVRKIVDAHLAYLDLKRPGLSNHALRHTGATLAYTYTHVMLVTMLGGSGGR